MRPQKGKQKIFDAAMKLFESQGYFATTVEQITVEAGVSKGLVYNYFASKEALLVGIIEDTTQKMESVAVSFESGESLDDSLTVFINNYFHYLKSESRFLKLQLTLMLMPELQGIVHKPQQERAELMLSMVSGWFKQCKIAKAKYKARLFIAMLDGVALHYLSIYQQYPLTAMKPVLIQAVRELCQHTDTD